MPHLIECEDCGTILLGIDISGPKPIGHDECPKCGGTEFRRSSDSG